MSETVGVGLLGLGTVGAGVLQLLQHPPPSMRRRMKAEFEVRKIAVRDPDKQRQVACSPSLLTGEAMSVVEDPGVELVVEVTGAAAAYDWVRAALQRGKGVVTANKALLAEHGQELFSLALQHGAELMFEASVAGGIPIIRALRNGLVANQIESLYGILNGTTNYILTQMTRGAGDYPQILRLAQEKGFAEPDPTMDVSGRDAAQKLSILCRIAFHCHGRGSQIFCEGIEQVESRDIEYARELGYIIKLLAIAKQEGGRVEARVHPAMVPVDSLLANIHDEFNAVEVIGSAVGSQVFYGRGAGQMPTASAVVSDMIEVVERKLSGAGPAVGDMVLEEGAISIADSLQSPIRYFLRMWVCDRPGVLEKIAHVLASERISIASVIQKERDLQGGAVPLVIVTHEASEVAMQRAVSQIDALAELEEKVRLIRMEEL